MTFIGLIPPDVAAEAVRPAAFTGKSRMREDSIAATYHGIASPGHKALLCSALLRPAEVLSEADV
jgi:hypothetical protein